MNNNGTNTYIESDCEKYDFLWSLHDVYDSSASTFI